ncbi:D-hexose-6-phosphate mutarotase [Enterovibrio nigricans]|uniref:Putative glucose-6-phosphate 1-epimerase n=1 Tax=Enterovibrio nigricans DSM 22720 TaxID=1121868 RepID=A0A1T4UD44_9GAMM|nr:D-hexose-6-phosphate mutarotase [Enterovibrio nigricans]PKF50192.1 D-hexose-6-phosphate mutarotase [Enterovibrio nigricans]SKA50526.1 glucose-6-phosphate 1-epimerase [Enterovibrio nigricans DSM 22720]
MDVRQLPTTAVLSDFVTVCELDGLKVIRVIHPKATAAVSLFGAHVLSFQPTGKEDAIWMSENADFSGNKAIRGGIPVCWPWFGKAAEPSHGFARSSTWTLKEHRESENGVIISLTLEDNAETREIWPHAFHAELLIEVSETLKVSLISTNTGKSAINVGGALHTYLNIGDVTETTVSALGNEYIEAGERKPSSGTTGFDQEVDRIYTCADETVVVEDPAYQRRMTVTNTGNNAVVVWNPWEALSISMGDMADDSYQTMVCVESAVYDRSVILEPGDKHILTTLLACQ